MLIRFSALLPLLSALFSIPIPLDGYIGVDSHCSPATHDCVDAAFRSYWEQNGGLPVFGYPINPALPEETPDGARTVQHFERNRLELHSEAPGPYTIQLGRLGVDRLAQLNRPFAHATDVPPAPGCRFFPATGHNLCGAFLEYWRAHGLDLSDPGISERESLALFGMPLTEPAVEVNASGDRVLTQWFERARFEDHEGTILQGLLDSEIQAALTPTSPKPGFVEVAGNQLVQQGQAIILKGANYYPADHPWSFMWKHWDAPAIERDLARGRRELGINSVRALVPYSVSSGWTDGHGNVKPEMLNRLREFVQIAGEQQIKVIITLFDWRDPKSPAGSAEEGYDLKYLQTIVEAFKDDDRVLAWDLHNEPDNYETWQKGGAVRVVDWLGRMADAVRALDRHHPLTIGVGQPENLWQAGSDGRTIADLSDIISVHQYVAGTLADLTETVQSRTSKPVLLEEFAWASGPACRNIYYDQRYQRFLYYDEPSQHDVYQLAIDTTARSSLVGFMTWWFQDPPATLSYSVDEQGHFGLYRRDGTPKPAVGPFRTLHVPALPSIATSDEPLTVKLPAPLPPIYDPLIFDDGLVLRDDFKHFWNFFGGEALFGRPLTLAYRDNKGTVVQYFERARFELNEDSDVRIDPLVPATQTPEAYLDRVHLTPLGQQALAGQTINRVPDPQRPGVRYFPQTGHTLSGDFRSLWETRGEAFFGPPLTEAYDEGSGDGRIRVQYFTNWRFEQQGNGSIRFTPLGRDMLNARQCPTPLNPSP